MSTMSVLVTDGETRAVLAVTRGLAAAGFKVAVAAPPVLAASHWSRSVAERISMPDPLSDPAGFVAELQRVLAGGSFDVLMPGSDISLLDVSRHRDRLEPYARIGLPPHERVQRALDKAQLAAAGARAGLDPPPTAVCTGPAQALKAADEMGFPVLVKPVSSVIEGGPVRRRSGSRLVSGERQLQDVVATFGPALVQQYVDGRLVSFAGVFAGGRLLAEAVSHYHRTWPPEAGNACYSETIRAPADLRRRIVALLDDLGWEGQFELELLKDGDDAWHAIDFNPRPHGSLALAIAAGANLPAVWCRHLLGSSQTPVSAHPGTFYRWTDADLRHGLWQLRNGTSPAAAGVLRVRSHVVHPYGRVADPGPGVARLLELGGLAMQPSRWRRRAAPDRAPVVVIGAGPNGLAVTAHLRGEGIGARCFGEPMESWSEQMPAGMLLRSRRRSSHIADPGRSLTIDDYERAERRTVAPSHLALEDFVDYGRWFQRQAVPDVDHRKVREVKRDAGGFSVRLQDGERLSASRVIVAAGLPPFMHRPEPFLSLSSSACSHAGEHADLGGFSDRCVAVIGSGQSALECAALLHEAGADVEVLFRAESIHWLGDGSEPTVPAPPRRRPAFSISPPPTDVGGRATGWIAATPDVFRRIPRRLRPEIAYRCTRPAGAGWLRPRLTGVTLSCGRQVVRAQERDHQVTLRLDDGATRTVDHVLLGTGYRIDVRRYPFLAPELTADLRLADGYPVLGPGLESSMSGLHFMGAPAANSFGPIMRFVVSTWYSAPAVARRAAGRRQPPISFSF
jgi:predicted ATP-grasp superfamily ATP-dependent carboligase